MQRSVTERCMFKKELTMTNHPRYADITFLYGNYEERISKACNINDLSEIERRIRSIFHSQAIKLNCELISKKLKDLNYHGDSIKNGRNPKAKTNRLINPEEIDTMKIKVRNPVINRRKCWSEVKIDFLSNDATTLKLFMEVLNEFSGNKQSIKNKHVHIFKGIITPFRTGTI